MGGNRDVFSKHGLRNTKHRNLVYDMLMASDAPLTAESIFLKLREMDVPVSFSTVYRILDAFAARGLALKSGMSDQNKAAFELTRIGHRHRLICVGCQKTVAVEGCPLNGFEKALESETHFDITAHKLEIFGLCPACKGKQ